MLRPLRLIFALLAATSAAALSSFDISEPAYAPSKAQFVLGDESAFFSISPSMLTRVTQDGSILDPGGLNVLDGAWPEARSATTGAGLVVASCRTNACTRTVAVTTDGRLAWAVGGVGGMIAFDGTNFIVIDDRSNTLKATVIDRAGVVLRAFDVAALGGQCCLAGVVAAKVGDGLIVAWGYVSAVTAVRIDSSGRVGYPITVGSDSHIREIVIASSGDEALIAWTGTSNGIRAARLDADENAGPPVILTDVQSESPALAWDGARYRLAWQTKEANVNRVFTTDVDPATLLHGEVVAYGIGDALFPKIAVSGDAVLFTYDAGFFGPTMGRIVKKFESAGALAQSEVKSIFTRWQPERLPAIAWSGDRYTVMWVRPDMRGTLVGRELAADGTPLGPVTPLATVSPNAVHALRIASAGDVTLAIWLEDGRLRALRVERGLKVPDAPVILGESYYAAGVASSGNEFAVAWLVSDPHHYDVTTIHARILHPGRPIANEPPVVIAGPDTLHGLHMEWSGQSYAVVFQQTYPVGCDIPIAQECNGQDAYIADFTANGEVRAPRRFATRVYSLTTLARGRTGIVYFWCGEGCKADLLPHGYESEPKRIDIIRWLGTAEAVVWTGESFVGIAHYKYFFFDEDGRVLKGPSETQFLLDGPFQTPGIPIAAASSGDGRAMIVFIPHDPGRAAKAAILGVSSRRRAVRSGE